MQKNRLELFEILELLRFLGYFLSYLLFGLDYFSQDKHKTLGKISDAKR